MTKLTNAERRRVLEQLTVDQGYRCAVPSCQELWTEPAHIRPSGMGGQPSTFRADNLAGMCHLHHDIYDGRRLAGRQELMRELMEYTIGRVRQDRRALQLMED